MKKSTVTRLCGLILLLVLTAIVLPKTVNAATYNVESGKEYAANAGDKFTFTLSSKSDVAIIGDETLEIWYGSNSEASDYKLDLSVGAAVETLEGRTWYFRVKSGRGSISFTWGNSNDTVANATEFTLNQGETKRIDDSPKYRYYVLKVTDPSAKYTFTLDNDVVHLDIFKGKISEYNSADRDYRLDEGGARSYVLTKGEYTLAGVAFSKNVQFTVKRENWVGISKLSLTNNGEMIGEQGKKVEYKVNYEPKNADSVITVKDDAVKLKSQSNGVAVFTVDYTDKADTGLTYDNSAASRSYNKVKFVSEEGLTATAEKVITPSSPKIDGTLTGTTKAVSIPVAATGADEFVAYVKNGSQWKECGRVKVKKGGLTHYVGCMGLKAGKTYTFRVYSYAGGKQGGYVETKGITAYNVKPTKGRAVCKKTTFYKKKKAYEWRFASSRGWYKVIFSDHSTSVVKVTYKKPKKAKGTYVTVNGKKLKSGKTIKIDREGKTKSGEKATIILQSVRKSGNCIAYGPSVKVKCKLKGAK